MKQVTEGVALRGMSYHEPLALRCCRLSSVECQTNPPPTTTTAFPSMLFCLNTNDQGMKYLKL